MAPSHASGILLLVPAQHGRTIVPEGTKSPASLPSNAATRASSAATWRAEGFARPREWRSEQRIHTERRRASGRPPLVRRVERRGGNASTWQFMSAQARRFPPQPGAARRRLAERASEARRRVVLHHVIAAHSLRHSLAHARGRQRDGVGAQVRDDRRERESDTRLGLGLSSSHVHHLRDFDIGTRATRET